MRSLTHNHVLLRKGFSFEALEVKSKLLKPDTESVRR